MLADAVGRWLATDYDFARRRRLAPGEEICGWQLAPARRSGTAWPATCRKSRAGMGGSPVDALIVMQALGPRAGGRAVPADGADVGAAARACRHRMSSAKHCCPQIVAGDCRVVVATLEPGARFDLDHVETRAVARGRRVRAVRAERPSSVGADSAHYLIVSARTSGEARDIAWAFRCSSCRSTPSGLAVRATPTIDGQRAAEITLNERRSLGADALLGTLHARLRANSSVRSTAASRRSAPRPSARWSACWK